MKLNRHNYEEYFILYMDNELGSEDRREVEFFVEQNPDLKAELDMLLQAKLSPDTDIHFDNKELLMVRNSAAISLTNYEEWLLSYIDNELSKEETKDVEQFVANNPAIAAELRLLLQTKLQPEAIVFTDKQSLYRREEKARVIGIGWRRIAIAASLLIAISTTAIVLINNKPVKPGNVAVKTPTIKEGKTQPLIEPVIEKEQIANSENNKIEVPKENTITPLRKSIPSNKKSSEPEQEESQLAHNQTRPSNNLPTPTKENRFVNSSEKPLAFAVKDTPSIKAPLTKDNEKPQFANVTDGPTNSSDIAESGNKGVRGFFRKVTRTIEKRTNINPTNDDNRLLVAGLAINMN